MRKIEKSSVYFKKNIHRFRCPLCQEAMHIKDTQLICEKNHSFDLAKKGYVHMLQKVGAGEYSKEMFASRRSIYELGFFKKVTSHIAHLIGQPTDHVTILDVGCGEGHHLASVKDKLINSTGIGVDLSKAGIQLASDYTDDLLWVVAHLDTLPFKDESIDVILNIFSPANSQEFQRVLTTDGIVVKAIPGPLYLQELRRRLYGGHIDQLDTEDVVRNFKDKFDVVEQTQVQDKVTITQTQLPSLIDMTPVSWDAGEEQKRKVKELSSLEVTVDVVLLVGQKK